MALRLTLTAIEKRQQTMSEDTLAHQITIVRNDPQMSGKPCAFFIDCTCGWGADYVSTNREGAALYAATHKPRLDPARYLE